MTVCGWIMAYIDLRRRARWEIEMTDSRLALEPFMKAEQERMLLRTLRNNRDEENELMKDVPGWKTGTYLGETVFHGQAGRFPMVRSEEIYAHNSTWAHDIRI